VYSTEQARLITQAAEVKAKETIKVLSENMSSLVKSYDALVEQREALLKSLRRLSQDALNQIDLSESHFSRIDAKAYHRAVEDLGRANYFSVANLASMAPSPEPTMSPEPVEAPIVHLDLYSAEEEALLKGEELSAESVSPEEVEVDLQDAVGVAEAEESQLEEHHYEEALEETQEAELPREDELEEEELAGDALEEEEEIEEVAAQAAATQPDEDTTPAPESAAPATPEKPKEDESKPSSGSFFDQFD